MIQGHYSCVSVTFDLVAVLVKLVKGDLVLVLIF